MRRRMSGMKRAAALTAILFLVSCGGGGGGSGGGSGQTSQAPPPPAPPPPVNHAPVADAGADQQVVEENLVSLDGSASTDEDGDITTFAWAQLEGPAVDLDAADSDAPSFLAPTVDTDTTLRFRLTVSDAEAEDTDAVAVVVRPETYALSGTVTAARGIDVDGDVNDPDAPYLPNDSADQAQPVTNPVIAGGYVNQPGAGEEGRSQLTGDISDYYRVSVAAGQRVMLQIADSNQGDLDLYLWNADGTSILSQSQDTDDWESLVVAEADAGEVLVEVTAFSGASNYALILDQAQVGNTGGLGASADFVPGEVILERRAGGHNAQSQSASLSALGVHPQTDAAGRPVLARVSGGSGGTRVQPLGVAAAGDRRSALAGEAERRRYDTLLAIKALRRDPTIRYAQLNYLARAQAVPDDPHYDNQWHYPMIDLPSAWDHTLGDPAVTVAVIDTGVLTAHPDLAGRLSPGYDFISDPGRSADGDGIDPDPDDAGDGDETRSSSFHGSHVAGIVGAASNNGTGVAGVAPDVSIVPLRVLGIDGGTAYDIIQGIRFAAGLPNDSGIVPSPVDVMNLSLGRVGECTVAEQTAFDEARAQGVTVVVAAGNESIDASGAWPANCHGVIAVGAVDLLGKRTGYSNFGDLVDVQAPGGDVSVDRNGDGNPDGVLSLAGDDLADPFQYGYGFAQGTSMAAPHVAGVIALMKSVNRALTPPEVDQLLADGGLTDERGVINAFQSVSTALEAAGEPPALDPTLTVTPASLNFGSAFTEGGIDVQISGGGSLQAQLPTVSESWLKVFPLDTAEDNIGRYTVTVDRVGLSEGTYSAVITVESDRNTVEVPVIMQVSGNAVDADAGHLHVLLVEGGSGNVVDSRRLDASAGRYAYDFSEVEPGDYEIRAGTDLDNDGFICDRGERCGAYPSAEDGGIPFTVEGDRAGLDFSVGDTLPLPGQTETGELTSGTRR